MSSQAKTMQELWQDSYLASGNEIYLEDLYETYLTNPGELSSEWRDYFDNLLQNMPGSLPDVSHSAIREQFIQLAKQSVRETAQSMESYQDQRQERIIELISAYRRFGHLQANIDPLGLNKGVYSPTLELAYYGFSAKDANKVFNVGSFVGLNKGAATLDEIHQGLRRVYCGTIGFEYRHINRAEEIEWIRERIEQGWANFKITPEEKYRILDRLVVADGLEKYLGFKYVGQKRFSLEGVDALIPFLDTFVRESAKKEIKEIIIGMAHRGRLNVLVNIVGKQAKDIFAAFEGKGVP